MTIPLYCDTTTHTTALEIANRFQFELITQIPEALYLHLSSDGLKLRHAQQNNSLIYIDFISGQARHRRLYGGGRKQPLGRAIGLKPGFIPLVCDVTAGLGRDAFVLACLGCHVMMVERAPVLAALLTDGLQRLAQDNELKEVSQRLQLFHHDSATWLMETTTQSDVIYLDPMYPKRQKTALVKKEMQLLQQIIGQDQDATCLLQIALQKARYRVVVKRPKTAPFLSVEPSPHFSIASENTRFDVYLTFNATDG